MKIKPVLLICTFLAACTATAFSACQGAVKLPHEHTMSFVKANEATCTEDGNTAYYVCSECGKWFEDAVGETEIADKKDVVIAKGHNIAVVGAQKATCTKSGNKEYYTCGECGKWFEDADGKTQIIDKSSVVIYMAHDFEDKICTECGVHEPTEGLKYTDKGDYYEVNGMGTATDTEIYIADIYNGKPVTVIADEAFRDCAGLKRVTLPYCLTEINDGAFEECASLENVEIPDGVTYLGTWAFSGCISFTDIIIPDSVTRLGAYTFGDCENLKSITIGSGVKRIDSDTFYGCTGLKDITFNGTRQQWEAIQKDTGIWPWDRFLGDYNVHCTDESFIDGHILTYVNAKQATCTEDGNKAYYSCSNCDKLFNDYKAKNEIEDKSSVVLPKGHKLTFVEAREATCTNSGNIAYFVCNTCKKWFSDKDGKDEINDSTVVKKLPHEFENKVCTECGYHEPTEGLSYYDYGGVCSVNGIGTATGTEIYIADEYNGKPVNTIDRLAFNSYGCENITSVTVPYSVTTIFGGAFRGCSSLSDIYYNGTKSQWDKIIKNSDWDSGLGEYTVHCDDVSTIYGHKLTFIKAVAATCTEDGHENYYTCEYCDRWFEDGEAKAEITDKEVVVLKKSGHNMTYFEEKAATCREKGHTAYYSCGNCDKWFEDKDGNSQIKNRTTVVIQKLAHVYENNVCTGCGAEKLVPTEGLEYTDKGEYAELSGIGEATDGNIVIADEYNGKPVTSIAENAFSWKALPTSIVIPDSVTSIGDGAFQGCSSVTSITIPVGLTTIGKSVFYGLGITSVEIPDGVTSIGEKAFAHCDKLTSVIIPDNVTSIGKEAFSWCRRLMGIKIGSGVISIGEAAFELCEKMESIVIPENVLSLGNRAFAKCTILKSVTLSKNITSFGRDILDECSLLNDIYFDGTSDEWYEPRKDLGNIRKSYTIHCTDWDMEVKYIK